MWFTLAYAALVFVGTLNREMTGVLLVLAFWALRGRDWKRGLLFSAIFAVTYGGLRLVIGPRPVEYTFLQTLEANAASWQTIPAALKNLAFVPLWLVALARLRHADVRLRRLTLFIVPLYVLAFLLAALWQEVRLWLPVVIILLPVIVQSDARQTEPDPTPTVLSARQGITASILAAMRRRYAANRQRHPVGVRRPRPATPAAPTQPSAERRARSATGGGA